MTEIEMDIVQVSQQSGLPASTLRYYEDKGLIRSIGRKGLRRVFHSNVVEKLALIALGRSAGFSLNEILSMFSNKGEPNIDRAKLLSKADNLDQRIHQLTAMRDGLRHAAQCSAPSHLECPKFQRLLRLVGTKPIRSRVKG